MHHLEQVALKLKRQSSSCGKIRAKLYDVIVVGAGVVGNYVADKLAELSYRVMIIEEHSKIGEPTQCTGIIGKECFDRFPIPDSIVLRQASSAKFFAPSGKCLRVARDGVQAYTIDRAEVDRFLAEHAQEKGAQYLLDSKVKDFLELDKLIRVEVDHRGKLLYFDGKAVVIASGFDPRFTERLGLGKIGDYITGAQAEVSANGIDEVEVYFGQEIAPGFFAWLVPTHQGRALVGLFSRRSPTLYLNKLIDSLYHHGKIASPCGKPNYGRIPLRTLPRTYKKRMIVVGDAAGQVKPTTGGGIYYGLLCGEIAVNTLSQALSSDDFSEKLFAQYERRWRKRLSRELQIGYLARRLYERLTDSQINVIFDIVQATGIHESLLRSPDFSFDWHAKLILEGLKHMVIRAAIGRQ